MLTALQMYESTQDLVYNMEAKDFYFMKYSNIC